MFSNSLRIILIIICLVFGIYQFFKGEIYLGFLFTVAAFFLGYGYFRYGNVWSAFQNLMKGRNIRAEKLINSVKYPNLLSTQQKAYYFFAKGVLEQDKNNWDEAENYYLKSLEEGLRTSNDAAIANLNLATIYHRKGLLDSANLSLRNAIELPHKTEVETEIQKLRLKLEV